jgi:putative oxidoreductase
VFNEIGFTHVFLLCVVLVALYRVRKALPGSGLRAWHERHLSPRGRARWHRVLLLECVELLLAGTFLLVGGAKLIGRPDMVALFRDIGVGQWFRYVTGAVEVSGAALLVVPFLSSGSAIVLAFVMFVATLIELFVLHRPPVAALACLSGHAFVAWARISKRHLSWLHLDHRVSDVAGNNGEQTSVLVGEP